MVNDAYSPESARKRITLRLPVGVREPDFAPASADTSARHKDANAPRHHRRFGGGPWSSSVAPPFALQLGELSTHRIDPMLRPAPAAAPHPTGGPNNIDRLPDELRDRIDALLAEGVPQAEILGRMERPLADAGAPPLSSSGLSRYARRGERAQSWIEETRLLAPARARTPRTPCAPRPDARRVGACAPRQCELGAAGRGPGAAAKVQVRAHMRRRLPAPKRGRAASPPEAPPRPVKPRAAARSARTAPSPPAGPAG